MKELTYKKFLGLVFGLTAAMTVSIALLNYRVDPLQFYRKAQYPPLLTGEKRFQNPGLAKNYHYDSIVMGTSLSENFLSHVIKEKLGWTALNFSMPGASAREQRLMLNLALETGKVKNVLWDVNYEYLRGSSNWVANFDGVFPEHFYDTKSWNELHTYLLNVDTTKDSAKVLLRKLGIKAYPDSTLDELYTWHTRRVFGTESVRKAWKRATDKRPTFVSQIPEYAVTNLNANFDQSFLAEITKHPEVKFHLYFPPFTVGYYAHVFATSPEIFQNMLANRRHIFERTKSLSNVELYDFQGDAKITTDLANYCDLIHFNTNINEHILDAVRTKQHMFNETGSENLQRAITKESTAAWVKDFGNR